MAARPATSISSSTAIRAWQSSSIIGRRNCPSRHRTSISLRLSLRSVIWYVVWSMLLLQIAINLVGLMVPAISPE